MLNEKPVRTVDTVKDDILSVIIDFNEQVDIKPEAAEFSIIYEDDCFLAVDKNRVFRCIQLPDTLQVRWRIKF